MKNIYEKPVVAVTMFDSMNNTNLNTLSSQGTASTATKKGSITKIDFGNLK